MFEQYEIAKMFLLEGEIIKIEKYGNGLINKTYIIITDKEQYILQKINNYVFKDVNLLMENIYLVTKYIKKKKGHTLELVKTKDNTLLSVFNDEYYRVYKMKKDGYSYESLEDDKLALRMGKIIGQFQQNLVDIDIDKVNKTIPFFHDIRHRYIDLIKSFRKCTISSKRKETKGIINNILKQYSSVMYLPHLISNRKIKERICHYDTKLNNFLFSKNDDLLIDLDTVMPGCSLYDYGDCARNILFNISEDSSNIDVKLNYSCFVYLTCGYLSLGKNYLEIVEIENIVNSIKVITLELSIRFLTDYLNGNLYFSINYNNQNLKRSLCQYNLYLEIIKEEKQLNELVFNIYRRLTNID